MNQSIMDRQLENFIRAEHFQGAETIKVIALPGTELEHTFEGKGAIVIMPGEESTETFIHGAFNALVSAQALTRLRKAQLKSPLTQVFFLEELKKAFAETEEAPRDKALRDLMDLIK